MSSRSRRSSSSYSAKRYYSKSKTRKSPKTSAAALYKKLGHGGAGTEKKGQDGKYWVLRPSTMRGVSTAKWVPCGKSTRPSCSKKYSKDSWWSQSRSQSKSPRRKSARRKSSWAGSTTRSKSRDYSAAEAKKILAKPAFKVLSHELLSTTRKKTKKNALKRKLSQCVRRNHTESQMKRCIKMEIKAITGDLTPRRRSRPSSRKSSKKSPRKSKSTKRKGSKSSKKSPRKSPRSASKSSKRLSLPANLKKSPVIKKLRSELARVVPSARSRNSIVIGCTEPTVSATAKCLRKAIKQSKSRSRSSSRKSSKKSPRRTSRPKTPRRSLSAAGRARLYTVSEAKKKMEAFRKKNRTLLEKAESLASYADVRDCFRGKNRHNTRLGFKSDAALHKSCIQDLIGFHSGKKISAGRRRSRR